MMDKENNAHRYSDFTVTIASLVLAIVRIVQLPLTALLPVVIWTWSPNKPVAILIVRSNIYFFM